MTATAAGPVYSIREIPFSTEGSWFAVSPIVGRQIYADDLHLVAHQTGMYPVLRLTPLRDGRPAAATVTATPSHLTWRSGTGARAGTVELTYDGPSTLRIRGSGLGLRIVAAQLAATPSTGVYLYRDPVDGAHVFAAHETGRRYRVTVLSAHVAESTGTQDLGAGERSVSFSEHGGRWEIRVEEHAGGRAPHRAMRSFDACVAQAAENFESFLDAVAPWRTDRTPGAALAAYVLWSATVRPAGFVTRPAMLASKHWMDKVWSWDHCFSALALAAGRPDMAWDQFQLPFDHQDAVGALPESIAHSEVLYNYVRPPIHGWAHQRLRTLLPTPPDRKELMETYRRLAAWTRFWLTARRTSRYGLPHYHHGDESGWSNATTFDPERVVESADVAAFLILQARELSWLACELGRKPAAGRWNGVADRLRAAMLKRLWNGEDFVVRGVESGAVRTCSSLLNLMPAALGAELPAEVLDALVRRIRTHLTEFGPATELPTSPHYQDDGDWRGPIWAPSTLLLEDGLRRGGVIDLADEISERFRRLCELSGFAENFDARTGAALRDPAHTWTASAYLILAAAAAERER